MPDDTAQPEMKPVDASALPHHQTVEERFNFIEHNQHHNSHYSAIEYIHGSPILILNLASYADSNYDRLLNESGDPGTLSLAVTDSEQEWATAYVAKHPGRDAVGLAKAMTIANHDSTLGSFPRALSFFDHQTFWSTIALILLSLVLLVFSRRQPTQFKPAGRIQNMLEFLVLYVRDDIVRPNLPHGDAWTPFFASLFLAILTCNLFGIFPFFATATGNIGVTAAFALVTFVLMMFMGIKNNGPVGFFVKLIPVKWSWNPMDMLVFVLIMFLEWLSLFTRPIILAIRLMANMLAGHTVLLVFLSLGFIIHESSSSVLMAHGLGVAGWLISIPFYVLEILVAVIQAYIFTLLSAIFIGQCAHPEH
jgi:F-type H+-transporting ATPase subunit a